MLEVNVFILVTLQPITAQLTFILLQYPINQSDHWIKKIQPIRTSHTDTPLIPMWKCKQIHIPDQVNLFRDFKVLETNIINYYTKVNNYPVIQQTVYIQYSFQITLKHKKRVYYISKHWK